MSTHATVDPPDPAASRQVARVEELLDRYDHRAQIERQRSRTAPTIGEQWEAETLAEQLEAVARSFRHALTIPGDQHEPRGRHRLSEGPHTIHAGDATRQD